MSILNAASNALRGVSNLTQGKLGGSLAQPNLTLFGTNIPGIPLVSFRDTFLTAMTTWVGSIPLRTQWIIFFDTFPIGLNSDILRSLEPVAGDKKGFDIDRTKKYLLSYPAQGIVGCIFAQGVNIPDDSREDNVATISNNRGFIPGRIGGNRSSFTELTIEFRETNSSFADSIIRPWVILSGHAGMVARDSNNKPELNPKTNITVIQYTRSFQKLSQIPRKIWRFYNCVPKGISNRNLTYDQEAFEKFQTTWNYSHYTLEDNLYLPLPDLINKFSGISVGKNIAKITSKIPRLVRN
jgi:hypothetical protein